MPTKPPPVVILAGGAGRRLGGNKPFYVHEGRPLVKAVIERLAPQTGELLINCGGWNSTHSGALKATGIPVCIDDPRFADLGPLSGVHSAMKAAAGLGAMTVVTAPCDMPNLPPDMVAVLFAAHDAHADVSHFTGARDYPLCAIWTIALLPALEAALEAARTHGGLAVMRWLQTCRVNTIVVSDDMAFVNINQPSTGEAGRRTFEA